MLIPSNLAMVTPTQELTSKCGSCNEIVCAQLSFDPEFSLPPFFFDKDFLDNCDLSEPQEKERMQPNNLLLRKQIGLLERSQE